MVLLVLEDSPLPHRLSLVKEYQVSAWEVLTTPTKAFSALTFREQMVSKTYPILIIFLASKVINRPGVSG